MVHQTNETIEKVHMTDEEKYCWLIYCRRNDYLYLVKNR